MTRKFKVRSGGQQDDVDADDMQNVGGVLQAKKFKNGSSAINGEDLIGQWKEWTSWIEVFEPK